MIKINGVDVLNQASEMTLKQYEDINLILNNKNTDTSEKYIKVFKYFGVDENYIDNLEFTEFAELIKEFGKAEKVSTELVKEIEINRYTYRAFDESFKISVKDLKEVEKVFKKERYICDLMAIFFKRTDLTNAEHFAPAHLKEKSKLFRELNAEFCVPYLYRVGQLFAERLQDAKSEVLV